MIELGGNGISAVCASESSIYENDSRVMGCGTSKPGRFLNLPDGVKEDGDIRLPHSKIVCSQEQLDGLNEKFSKLVESAKAPELKERQIAHVGVVVERLVQRLVCNVGSFDSRFSSKFLISLQSPHNQTVGKRLSFKYVVRLDALSSPALYPEHFQPPVKVVEGSGMDSLPQGYVKVRVHGEYLEQWSEFINASGFLRRDKIQERFIELLARAAARPTEPSSPAQVDESRLCGSPGKIVDPVTLYHILKLPPSQHVFYGPAECNESRFPDPRDFRIAIVEGTPDTTLHVSFLSPTAQNLIGEGEVEIVLTLGIGAAGWPLTTDFPSRYPLDHVDVFLVYQSAQMDYYVVPKGPAGTVRSEDRTTLWEIRAFPTEMFLEYHYSPNSAIGRIFKVLALLLELLRSRGVKTINRYILKNLVFFELETKKKIEQWTPKSVSRRVLTILDHLLHGLRNQSLPSYFFTRKNLLLQEGALEEDYVSDGDILEHYIRHLSRDGLRDDKCYITIKDQLENVMLQKWTTVVSNLLPPVSNRGRRLSVSSSVTNVSYTRRQMEYVALLFREILKLKQVQQKQSGRDFPANRKREDFQEQASGVEDVVYLLQIVFTQAKERLFADAVSNPRGCDANRKKYKMSQMMRSFDVSTSMLIDDFRRNNQNSFYKQQDMDLVAAVIECLYKATDSDGRVLGPVLRPYLNQLFKGSHENCWFLPEWKKKMDELEFGAIGAFSSLVVSGAIDPLSGVLDSAKKGWNWAKNCLQIMQSIRSENSASVIVGDKIDSEESGLRIVFAPAPCETVRFNLRLPKDEDMTDEKLGESPFSTMKSTSPCKRNRVSSYATIRSFPGDLQTIVDKDGLGGPQRSALDKQPPHAKLRDANPFTFASMEARRRGTHRGLGSIVQALISLQKLTVLQEISEFLPQEDKRKVLNDIKKLSKEVQRLTVSNYRKRNLSLVSSDNDRTNKKEGESKPKWKSATLPGRMRGSELVEPRSEVYRSMNEFSEVAGDEEEEEEKGRTAEGTRTIEDSLLGTCRLLRRQERQRVLGVKSFGKISSTLPKNAINTPFYLKVTTFERGREEHKTRRHINDFMQF